MVIVAFLIAGALICGNPKIRFFPLGETNARLWPDRLLRRA
jgi:hypothetical protein